jgi:hypothetical protein
VSETVINLLLHHPIKYTAVHTRGERLFGLALGASLRPASLIFALFVPTLTTGVIKMVTAGAIKEC